MLSNQPLFIDAIAEWLHSEWGWFTPELTLDDRRARLARQLTSDHLPIVFVAHEGDKPLGTASLRASDMDSRAQLTPWLAGVFVAQD